MKICRLTIVLFFLLQSFVVLSQDNILFIGNSMTMYNSMPQMVKQIATSKGKTIEVDQFTIGGQGLAQLSANPDLYDKIHSKNWTVVVIQPGTNESGAQVPISQSVARAQRIIDSVKVNSPCARFYLYEISNGVISENNEGNYVHYFQTQTLIKNTITSMADALEIPFIPAGEAVRAHYTATPDLMLHNAFWDVHPNYKGSYLIANCVFATIYQERVFPSTYIGNLEQSQADYLQNLADNTVFTTPSEWHIGTHQPHVFFDVVVEGAMIYLQNHSANYDNFQWNINNEYSTSTDLSSYEFNSLGEKTITLTIEKNGCSYVYTKKISITSLSNVEHTTNKFEVYPNPFVDVIHFSSVDHIKQVSLFDMEGKQVLAPTLPSEIMSLSKLSSGVYFLYVTNDNGEVFVKKLVKK